MNGFLGHCTMLQVTQLDMTIKEHKCDMEQHIIRLEGTLKKAQIELQQKSKQVNGNGKENRIARRKERT